MKKRIGVYNKKIVVAGDANLAGPNEIHISELNGASSGGSSGGEGSGSGSGETLEYYKIDYDKANDYDSFWDIFDSLIPFTALISADGGVFYGGDFVNADLGRVTMYGMSGLNTQIILNNEIVDEGSWIANVNKHIGGNYNDFMDVINNCFIPVTKEQFYNLKAEAQL